MVYWWQLAAFIHLKVRRRTSAFFVSSFFLKRIEVFVSSSGKGEVFYIGISYQYQNTFSTMALKILEVNLPSNFLRLTVYTSRLLQRRAGMVLFVLNLLIPDIIYIYIIHIIYTHYTTETFCEITRLGTHVSKSASCRCPQMQRLYVVPGGSLGAFAVCALKAAATCHPMIQLGSNGFPECDSLYMHRLYIYEKKTKALALVSPTEACVFCSSVISLSSGGTSTDPARHFSLLGLVVAPGNFGGQGTQVTSLPRVTRTPRLPFTTSTT